MQTSDENLKQELLEEAAHLSDQAATGNTVITRDIVLGENSDGLAHTVEFPKLESSAKSDQDEPLVTTRSMAQHGVERGINVTPEPSNFEDLDPASFAITAKELGELNFDATTDILFNTVPQGAPPESAPTGTRFALEVEADLPSVQTVDAFLIWSALGVFFSVAALVLAALFRRTAEITDNDRLLKIADIGVQFSAALIAITFLIALFAAFMTYAKIYSSPQR